VGRVRTRTNSGMGLEGCGVGSRRRWPPWPEKLMRNGNSLAGEGAGPSMEAPRGEAAVSVSTNCFRVQKLGT
jgi:hypothetical protein